MMLLDAINGVSTLYKEKRGLISAMRREMTEINNELSEAEETGWENITVARRDYLTNRYDKLTRELEMCKVYADGVSAAREVLLNLYCAGEETEN